MEYNYGKLVLYILFSKVKEDIWKVVFGDSIKSIKDIMKGFGIGYVFVEVSLFVVNVDCVRRERKMVFGKWMLFYKEFCLLDEIFGFEKIRKKVEGN